MLKVCIVCESQFVSDNRRRKTCSIDCKMALQRKTLGRVPSKIHGFAREGEVERLHNIWRGMIKRCTNSKDSSFNRYGGRGILICDEWSSSYVTFRTWALLNGYTDVLTIDRIDNDGNYEPNNCRWVSNAEQSNNRRNSRFVEINGETKTLADWARLHNMPYGTVCARINVCGMGVEQALTEPIVKTKTYHVKDVGELTLSELANYTGIKPDTLRYRLKHHPLEDVIKVKDMRCFGGNSSKLKVI